MLSEKDYTSAANFLGCEVNVIKAVTQVEAPRGAYEDNHITVLFEPYQFYKELKYKDINPDPWVKKFPDLCSPVWDKNLYGTYKEQWDKLQGAANINAEAAYRSASYGLFQVMGFNAEWLGYKDVFEFYQFLSSSEVNQLIAFCKYVKASKLETFLINKDWESFSRKYNGQGFKSNSYDTKLKQAYEQLNKS